MTNNPVYSFFATPASLAPLILRLTIGGIFFFHGAQNSVGWFGGAGWKRSIALWMQPDTWHLPYIVAAAVIIGQILIMLGLIFGLFTRVVAFGVILIMAGAIVISCQDTPIHLAELENSVLILSSAVALLFLGGGVFSMDRGISKGLLPTIG